jgi:hypothetical protein
VRVLDKEFSMKMDGFVSNIAKKAIAICQQMQDASSGSQAQSDQV